MVFLTVGYVSGFIALCIYTLQLLFPNLIALLLVASLGRKATAVTWSVAGRELQSSLWPSLLRSDTASSTKVAWNVSILVWTRLAAFAVVAIAAVVTPLGLHEAKSISDNKQETAFAHVPDDGPMGYGTPPRSSLGFTRTCAKQIDIGADLALVPWRCPGDDFVLDYDYNNTNVHYSWNGTYDVRIPREKAMFLQSGLDDQPSTV